MRVWALAVFVSVLAFGCGSSSSPAVPSPSSSVNLSSMTGSWTGMSADSTGQEKMIWTVTQDGSTMSGTMNFSDGGRGMMGNGGMRGTINGRTVTFHIDVPSGGFNGMMSSCSMFMDGQATMSDDGHTMTGTYSGSMSGTMSPGGMMSQLCGGPMNDGRFTLTR